MFCMNCGQQLPDGAKFCLNCGTPQGAVSPTGTTQAETINLDGMHTFVPAMCPNCNAHLNVNQSTKIARCDNCGTECLVQDAIKTLTVKGNVQVGNATINVSGINTDALLQRVEIVLSDGDFKGAIEKCNTILDSDPTNGNAYFFMLLADLRCKHSTDLANQENLFDGNPYYKKAMQYGDNKIQTELLGYLSIIKKRIEEKQRIKEEKERIEEETLKDKLIAIKIGDTFSFGTFNELPMEWIVLKIQDHMAFIIKTNVLEGAYKPYHMTSSDITWRGCSLRTWLNNDFLNTSFTTAEKTRIIPRNINNDDNSQYKVWGGVPTIDKIFLLSIHEAETLFKNDQARAVNAMWWLRSPGSAQKYAAIVNQCGIISKVGVSVNEYGLGDSYQVFVRPAMWIKLD